MAQSRAARKQTRGQQSRPPRVARVDTEPDTHLTETGPLEVGTIPDQDLDRMIAATWSPPVPRAVERLGSDQRAALYALAGVASDLAFTRQRLDETVAESRAVGVSWAAIGLAVGTTGEAARQRWSQAR